MPGCLGVARVCRKRGRSKLRSVRSHFRRACVQQDVSGPLLAQAPRRRRAKARRKPHATKRPVIGTASPRLNRSADNASDTADNASNTAAATATLKACLYFIPGCSKRSHGLRGCKGDVLGIPSRPNSQRLILFQQDHPWGRKKIGARAQIIGAFGRLSAHRCDPSIDAIGRAENGWSWSFMMSRFRLSFSPE